MTDRQVEIKKQPIDYEIHKQRVVDEMVFQLLIKEECLQNISVGELKEIAQSCSGTVRHVLNRYISPQDKAFVVTDKKANKTFWIHDLLEETYMRGNN